MNMQDLIIGICGIGAFCVIAICGTIDHVYSKKYDCKTKRVTYAEQMERNKDKK